MNMRRSGASAFGLISTPFSACHVPANRRSGPRLASVSGSTSCGSVKMSAGKMGIARILSMPQRFARTEPRINRVFTVGR
jgi:hypothetical protein